MHMTVLLASGERLKFNNVVFYELDYSDKEMHISQHSPYNNTAETYISKSQVVAVTIGE